MSLGSLFLKYNITKLKTIMLVIITGYAQSPVSKIFNFTGNLTPSIEPKINVGKITVVNVIRTSEIVTRKTIQDTIPVL